MGQVGSWNGYVFEVSPSVVRGFTGLSIEGGSVTEDKVSDKYAYVKRKNSSPTTVNLEIYLNAYLGCNVRDEAMAFIKAATEGTKNYFYSNGKKLVTCQLMLVNAKITETTMTPSGEWTSCRIALTMKQCEKYSGGSSSGSSSSSGGSSKKTQAKKESVKQQSVTTPKAGTDTSGGSATDKINSIVNAANNVGNTLVSWGTSMYKGVAKSTKTIAEAKQASKVKANTASTAKKTSTANNKIEAVKKGSKQ